MADQMSRYPLYDPAKADLLICPLSGRPILRVKDPTAGPGAGTSPELQLAVERDLPGPERSKVWIAKNLA
jgi:hypothetical protein